MAKNIVFFADGTWNGDSQDSADITSPTNVLKLYLNLAGADSPDDYRLADEQERVLADAAGNVLQIAKYIHGVGDSDNPLVKLLGGTVGAGLIARVIRGYTFVSRNYVAGDAIFLVGFSRGAYTVRALAGMIAARGLLDATANGLGDPMTAYKLGAAVWTAYRRDALQGDVGILGRLEGLISMLPGFFDATVAPNQLIPAPVDTVAVWDTVGSMGIPTFDGEGVELQALRFVDTTLSANVGHAFHAIAVDEQRGNFPPTLWDADPRIVQVLFPGAHADVGGGYPTSNNESGLSDQTLVWMTENLRGRAVQLALTPTVVPSPSASGVAHAPWTHAPWNKLDICVRADDGHQFPAGLTLSPEVTARINAGLVGQDPGPPLLQGAYAPSNLSQYLP